MYPLLLPAAYATASRHTPSLFERIEIIAPCLVSSSQECIYFEEEDAWGCAVTTCDPNPCADNEYCNVEERDCAQEPCPTIAFCRDACNGQCIEGEVCELNDEVAPQCVPVEAYCNMDGACEWYQVCVRVYVWVRVFCVGSSLMYMPCLPAGQ